MSNEPTLIGIEIVSKEKLELDNIRTLIMANYERGPLTSDLTLEELRELSVFDLVANCLSDLKEAQDEQG